MKLKSTLLALITSGLLLSAITTHAADAEKSYYGSVRIGAIKSTGTTADFANWNSRLGLKGETEVRKGLTGFGKYEIGVNLGGINNGNSEVDKDFTTRHAFLGLRGKAGEVTLGKTDHTYYNLGVAPVDVANWWSCNGCVGDTSRTTGITYKKSFGKLTVGATHMMRNSSDDRQKGNELGLSYQLGKVALGIASQKRSGEDTATSATISGSKGKFSYAAYLGTKGSTDGVDLHLGYSNYYFTVGQKDTAKCPRMVNTLSS